MYKDWFKKGVVWAFVTIFAGMLIIISLLAFSIISGMAAKVSIASCFLGLLMLYGMITKIANNEKSIKDENSL